MRAFSRRSRHRVSWLVAAALSCVGTTALAEAPETRVSVTLAPLHLLTPLVELTAEVRVADRVGVAGIVGVGRTQVAGRSSWVWDAGAQGRYAVLGDFDACLHLALEAVYTRLSSGEGNGPLVTGSALSLAPLVGYKHTFPPGLVLEAQAGPGFSFRWAEAASGQRAESGYHHGLALVLNLNLGWAF